MTFSLQLRTSGIWCSPRVKPLTHVRETQTRNSCELTRTRNLYVCHTDLQQDISWASFSHQIERVLFRASFSCEFLVRVSRASVMGLTVHLNALQNASLQTNQTETTHFSKTDYWLRHVTIHGYVTKLDMFSQTNKYTAVSAQLQRWELMDWRLWGLQQLRGRHDVSITNDSSYYIRRISHVWGRHAVQITTNQVLQKQPTSRVYVTNVFMYTASQKKTNDIFR